MTIVYSPDTEQQTNSECLFYIQEFQGKRFTATLAREFAAQVEKKDYKLIPQLDETIDESTDVSAVTAANKQLDKNDRDLNMELEVDRSLCYGVERFIAEILYTFGIE